ncbi:AIM24 family protein [Clostridium sp. SYSU_GA19001]|uniref:AIM24 family protein n=1 Tax=Clostridium caldaquaticum TaxID=2940653 RepID=UPI002076F148|nr:AIM24 family protein [Clostridium caldaquaticum]MCM8710093.1 AIM24 family protein [Clostridium caldaquaticum]
MKANINFQNNLKKISEMQGENVSFEILEYPALNGSKDVESAVMLSFMKDANIKLKQAKVTLRGGSVKLEAGALSFLKGNIEMDNNMGGILGLGKKLLTSKVTGETAFKPRYKGTGEIFLEPSFGHYALIFLENEEIVVDDGLFYACEDSVEVGAYMQKNISATIMGNEGLFQTKLSGRGIVLLEIPVPESEIVKYTLNNETLKVDGNFALLRSRGIEFTVEKSSKSLLSSATSGEGLLNVFRGTGEVWIAPTQQVYNRLRFAGLMGMTNPGGSSNTKV